MGPASEATPGREAIRALPKLDLHCHLDGAARTSTLLELAREAGHALPGRTVDELAPHVRVSPDCRSLREFLATFDVFYPVLSRPGAMQRLARECLEDQAADGVVHVELRFCPALQSAPGFPMEAVVEDVLSGLRGAAPATGISWGVILCCYRALPRETHERLVDVALERAGDGVVAVDLAGPEDLPGAPAAAALRRAREAGLAVTVHAGEAAGPDSVREAIEALGAQRLGHGVALREDPALTAQVRELGLPLECCLSSNLATGTVASLAEHPFDEFLRAGLAVTLNTDDPAVCDTTLTDEYLLASRTWGYDLPALRAFSRAAVDAAFVTEPRRAELRRLVDQA